MIQCVVCASTFTKRGIMWRRISSQDRLIYGCVNCKEDRELPKTYKEIKNWGYLENWVNPWMGKKSEMYLTCLRKRQNGAFNGILEAELTGTR